MTIIARLQDERVAEQRRLKRQLKKIDPGTLLNIIDDICSSPRIFDPASNALFVPVATAILQAVAVREKPMLDLLPEALVEANVLAQHRLRVAVKRFRYRVEFLAPFAKSDYKTVYATIKEYQEILGHMHDLDVFIGLIPSPDDEAGKNRWLRNIICERRSALFRQFIRLHQAHPLNKTGDLVRGLL
jgi:CHAD domain-containing protein